MLIKITSGSVTETLAQGFTQDLETPVLQGSVTFNDSVMMQVMQRLRAEAVTVKNRGNKSVRGSFSAATAFDSYEAAVRHAYTHPNRVLREGSIIIEVDANYKTTIASAVINSVDAQTDGARTLVTYQFSGGATSTAFTFTFPSLGLSELRTFDPNTCTALDALNFLTTLVKDYQNETSPAYTITEPSGGWKRTWQTAFTYTDQHFYDVVATLGHDLQGTPGAWVIEGYPYYYDVDLSDADCDRQLLGCFLAELNLAGELS